MSHSNLEISRSRFMVFKCQSVLLGGIDLKPTERVSMTVVVILATEIRNMHIA
jgi:hypothetical protein